MFFLACIYFLFILFVVALPSNVKTVLTEGFIFLKWSQETKFFCVNRLELVKAVHFQVWTKRLLGHFLCFLLTSGFLAAWAGLGAGVRLQREREHSQPGQVVIAGDQHSAAALQTAAVLQTLLHRDSRHQHCEPCWTLIAHLLYHSRFPTAFKVTLQFCH